MRPHRSYLAPIRKLIQAEVARGFAHITGGGITENLPRILPKGLAAQIDLATLGAAAAVHASAKARQARDRRDVPHLQHGHRAGRGRAGRLLKKARLTLTRMNERSMVIGRIVRKSPQRVIYS